MKADDLGKSRVVKKKPKSTQLIEKTSLIHHHNSKNLVGQVTRQEMLLEGRLSKLGRLKTKIVGR
jgi:hypothetical protein